MNEGRKARFYREGYAPIYFALDTNMNTKKFKKCLKETKKEIEKMLKEKENEQ